MEVNFAKTNVCSSNFDVLKYILYLPLSAGMAGIGFPGPPGELGSKGGDLYNTDVYIDSIHRTAKFHMFFFSSLQETKAVLAFPATQVFQVSLV